jgi:hypothetical protein
LPLMVTLVRAACGAGIWTELLTMPPPPLLPAVLPLMVLLLIVRCPGWPLSMPPHYGAAFPVTVLLLSVTLPRSGPPPLREDALADTTFVRLAVSPVATIVRRRWPRRELPVADRQVVRLRVRWC